MGLLLLWFVDVAAQQVQFKEPLRQSIRTYQIIEDQGEYLSVGQSYNSVINRYGIVLLKLDSLGKTVKSKEILDSSGIIYPSNHISLIKTLDNNFLTVAARYNPLTSHNLLLKFDENLSILAEWVVINDSFDRGFYQAKQLPDSGFVITGYWYDQPKNMYHADLVRIDKNGQLLWEQVIKRPDGISLWPYQVYPTPDGGFLIAGVQVYLPDIQTQDALLIRTDSAGNLLWKQTYGGAQVDGVAAAAYRDDGNIMLFYSQGTHPIQQGHSLMPVFSIVDDITGQELQKKTYPFIDYRSFLSYNLLKDGNKFIGTGEFGPGDINKFPGGARHGYTIAVDENLSDLWFRNYYVQISTTRFDDWTTIYDIRPTSDGGYIAGGNTKTWDTTQLDVNLGFNGWIVKMDSMGCVEQSCINRIDLPEDVLQEELIQLSVYPNPSSGIFNLELSSDLDGIAVLYDLKGQKLQETNLMHGVGVLNLKNDLPPGIYLVKVMDEAGSSISKKVVVQ